MRSKKSQIGKKRRDALMKRTLLRATVTGAIAFGIVNGNEIRAQTAPAQATPKLPQDVQRLGITTAKASPKPGRCSALNLIKCYSITPAPKAPR